MLFNTYTIDNLEKHPSAHPLFLHKENDIVPGAQHIIQPDLHGNFLLFVCRFFQTGVLIGLDEIDYAKLVKLAEAPASERNQAWKEQTQALIDQIHINPSLSNTVYTNIGDTLCERAPHTDALKLMLFSRLKRDPNKEKLNLEEIYSNHGFAFLHWFRRILNDPKLQELAIMEEQIETKKSQAKALLDSNDPYEQIAGGLLLDGAEKMASEASLLRKELFVFKQTMLPGQESSLQHFCLDLQNGLFSVNEFKELVTDYISRLKLFSHSRGVNLKGEEIFTFTTHARASLQTLQKTSDWLKPDEFLLIGINDAFPSEIQSFTIEQCEAFSQNADANFKRLLFPFTNNQLSEEGLQKLLEKTALDNATKVIQKFLEQLHKLVLKTQSPTQQEQNSLLKASNEMNAKIAELQEYPSAYNEWKKQTIFQDGVTSYTFGKLYKQLNLTYTYAFNDNDQLKVIWKKDNNYETYLPKCEKFWALLKQKGNTFIHSFSHLSTPFYELIHEREAPAEDKGPAQDFLSMNYGHVGKNPAPDSRQWAKNMDSDCGKYYSLLDKNTALICEPPPNEPNTATLYIWQEANAFHWSYKRKDNQSCQGIVSNDAKISEFITEYLDLNNNEETKNHYRDRIFDKILVTRPEPLLQAVSNDQTYTTAHTCDKEMYGYYCQKFANILKGQKATLEAKLGELQTRKIFYDEQAKKTVENLVSTFNNKIIALEKTNAHQTLPNLQEAYDTCLTETNQASVQLKNDRIFGPVLRGIADALMTISVIGWAIGIHRISTGKHFWCSFHKEAPDSHQKTSQISHQIEEFNSFKMNSPAPSA